ncbi:MAG: outer membrane beta-barrel protein [Saprospiraceae bacterium]
MKTLLNLFLLIVLASSASAQKTGLKMFVRDSINAEALNFAAGSMIQVKDSQLVQVNYTDDKGLLEMYNLKPGEYYLKISYLSYETISRKISVSTEDSGKQLDLGVVKMAKKSTVLKDLTVKAEVVAVAMKGDTVEYNSKAFQTRPNASAEELLKKLPGVEVDKDGSVKAQGEGVNKILVDGKPFFGDDPKMATKNLPADAIDRVQVYDQKSEQSMFNGINDGNLGKTIDFKLKANRKQGNFGKINAGYGTDDRFSSAANYFRFKPGKQVALLGTANNINASPFTVQDLYSDLRRGGGNININTGSDDISSSLLGGQQSGINTVYSAGTNFSLEFNAKSKLTGSYFFNQTKQYQKTNSSRKYFQTDLIQNENVLSNDTRNTHRVNLDYEYKFDANNSIKVTPSLTVQGKSTKSSQHTVSESAGNIVNEQQRDVLSDNQSFALRGNAIYRHKFAKEGRTFSLSSNFNLSEGNGLDKNNVTLKDGSSALNQHWKSENRSSSAPVSISYTEPLNKKWKLETAYLFGKFNNRNDREAYLYSDDTKDYTRLDSTVSSDLTSSNRQQKATARLQYEKLRYTLTMEGAYEWNPRENLSRLNNNSINQNFQFFLPSVRFQYNLPKKMRWGMNYNTNVNYPTITQLISIPDNSNPLRIQKGNIELKPSYTHSFQTNFNKFDAEKNTFLHAFARFSIPENAYSTKTVFEAQGRQTSQTINVNGNYNYSSFFGLGMPIKKVRMNVDASLRGSNRIAYVNNEKSISFTNGLGGNFKFSYDPSENIDIVVSSGVGYNVAKNNLNSAQNNKFYNWDSGLESTVQLPGGIELSSEVTFNRYYGLSGGFNRYFTLWNASIAKSMLKDNTLEIKLSAFDILKQNQNINRDVTAQYIEDQRSVNLTQYFMLQATYFLNKAGRPDPKKDGMRMEWGNRKGGH